MLLNYINSQVCNTAFTGFFHGAWTYNCLIFAITDGNIFAEFHYDFFYKETY